MERNVHYIKNIFAPFNWKLFKLGSLSVRDIRKNDPILQVGGSAPATHTPPVIRVVLPIQSRLYKDIFLPLYVVSCPQSKSHTIRVWWIRQAKFTNLEVLIPCREFEKNGIEATILWVIPKGYCVTVLHYSNWNKNHQFSPRDNSFKILL